MKKVVQFGAGNIGRGFLGQLFFESNYQIIFVDLNQKLVDLLNKERKYPILIVGPGSKRVAIKNFLALPASQKEEIVKEIERADLLSTSVGAQAIRGIIPFLAEGIKRRAEKKIKEPINLIICENLLNSAKTIKKWLKEELKETYWKYLEEKVGLVETVVSRMVSPTPEEIRKKEPLLILTEEYHILPVGKDDFKGKIPDIEGFLPVENIAAYEKRKLFLHSLAHSICAYFGYLKGYRFIYQAIEDKEIREIVDGALSESNRALLKWGRRLSSVPIFSPEENRIYIEDFLKRIDNPELGDTVFRVGRDPLRKLSPEERLIGSAKLCQKMGIIPKKISLACAAALCYNYPEDEQAFLLQRKISSEGIEKVLKEICGLSEGGKLFNLVVKNYNYLKNKFRRNRRES